MRFQLYSSDICYFYTDRLIYLFFLKKKTSSSLLWGDSYNRFRVLNIYYEDYNVYILWFFFPISKLQILNFSYLSKIEQKNQGTKISGWIVSPLSWIWSNIELVCGVIISSRLPRAGNKSEHSPAFSKNPAVWSNVMFAME